MRIGEYVDVFRMADFCLCFDCGCKFRFQKSDECCSSVLGWMDGFCCFASIRFLGGAIPTSKYWHHLHRHEFKKVEPCVCVRLWVDSRMKGKMNARK